MGILLTTMNKLIRFAAYVSILFVILLIPIYALGLLRNNIAWTGPLKLLYISLLAIWVLGSIIFNIAWSFIGKKLKNNLLYIVPYIIIVITVIGFLFDVLTLGAKFSLWHIVISSLILVLTGIPLIFLGVGLLKTKKKFGSLATAAGVLEIITGVSFVLVVFSVIGLLLSPVATLIETILLFKASKMF